ncbi:class I SAM-dependent methyltransferase [uncultured Roseibium sp.]|uniref:class I SAM-dependent methyltransferase n=1 Tax=uncultured Roseibium sp. TaxID=1936171 RepID=UPI002622C1CB|nr:class I SAM-dependent methyltransferase [uncultured Roseibium sp.]
MTNMSGGSKPQNEYLDVTYGQKAFTGYPFVMTAHLWEKCSLFPGAKLLDLGCGRGEFLKGFMAKGALGYGFDQSDLAKQHCPEADVRVGDLEAALPYEDNFFDVIYSKSVVEHFYYPERILAEAYRILKPGGTIITMTPDWKYNVVDFHSDFTHRTAFTLKAIEDIHKITGFKEVIGDRFIQLPVYWKHPWTGALVWLARNFTPDFMKPKNKFIRFSKEVMLICTATK